MTSTLQEARLLAEGMTAAKNGDNEAARDLLTQVIGLNPRSELAWLWMSSVFQTPEQRHDCLLRVLQINPSNEAAKRGIAALQVPAVKAIRAVFPAAAAVLCPFCHTQTDGTQLDCQHCGENIILSCPTCEKPINLWETTRCPCGEGLRHYIFFPDGIDHEGLGQRYAMADRWEAAVRQWDRALAGGSHIGMLHRKLAQAYDKIGKSAEADFHRQVAQG